MCVCVCVCVCACVCVSTCVYVCVCVYTFPIDTIKTKMQVGQKVSLALPDLGQYFKGFR